MRHGDPINASDRALTGDAPAIGRIDTAIAIQRDALAVLIARLHEASLSDDGIGFGNLIRASQKLIGLSVERAARIVLVSPTTMQRWMTGTASPHGTVRRIVCTTLIAAAEARLDVVSRA